MARLKWLVPLMVVAALIFGAVYYFAFLPDGPKQVFKAQSPIVSFLPLPDGYVVVAEADGEIHLIDTQFRQKPQMLVKAEFPVSCGAISKDLKRFGLIVDGTSKYKVVVDGLRSFESTPDPRKSELTVWESAKHKQIGKLQFEGKQIVALAFGKDSSIVVFVDRSGKIYHWTIENEKYDSEYQLCEEEIRLAALSKDATLCAIASADGKVTIYDVKQRKRLKTIDGDIGDVSCLAFSPDGDMLGVGYTYGSIVVLETHVNGRRDDYFIAGGNPQLAFASDGRTVFVGSRREFRDPSYRVAMIDVAGKKSELVGVIKRDGVLRHVGAAPDRQRFYWSVGKEVLSYPQK